MVRTYCILHNASLLKMFFQARLVQLEQQAMWDQLARADLPALLEQLELLELQDPRDPLD